MTTTIGSGLGATAGFVAESSFGTFTTPTHFSPLTKETIKFKKNTQQSQGLYGGTVLRGDGRVLVTQEAAGGLSYEMRDRGFGLLFKQLLGAATTTTIGSSGLSQQAFSVADTVGESLTVQIGRPEVASGTIVPFSYTGGKLTDMTLAVSNSGLATLDANLDFQNGVITQAYAAASYVQSNVMSFRTASLTSGGTVVASGTAVGGGISAVTSSGSAPNIVASVTTTSAHGLTAGQVVTVAAVGGATQINGTWQVAAVTSATVFTILMGSTTVSAYTSGGTVTTTAPSISGGTALATATGMQLKFTNPYANARFYLGASGLKAEQILNNFRPIGGQVDFEFNDTSSVLAAYYADTPLALQMNFSTGVNVATSGGGTTSGLTIIIPQIRWDGDEPNVDGPNILKYTAPIVGLFDGTNSPAEFIYQTLDSAP